MTRTFIQTNKDGWMDGWITLHNYYCGYPGLV